MAIASTHSAYSLELSFLIQTNPRRYLNFIPFFLDSFVLSLASMLHSLQSTKHFFNPFISFTHNFTMLGFLSKSAILAIALQASHGFSSSLDGDIAALDKRGPEYVNAVYFTNWYDIILW